MARSSAARAPRPRGSSCEPSTASSTTPDPEAAAPEDVPPTPSETGTPTSWRRRPAFGCLIEIVETVALTLIIFFVIQTFVAQPYEVDQTSMERTLEPHHFVLVDKLTPRFDPYKRGDIVVFHPPDEVDDPGDAPFIKRVIGLPGDTVAIEDGHVLINDTAIDEPYVFEEDGRPQPTDPNTGETRWTVPDGELFLMGDHRESSEDSRTFGPVEIDRVIGRAWLRYWPLGTFGILPTPTYPQVAPSGVLTLG